MVCNNNMNVSKAIELYLKWYSIVHFLMYFYCKNKNKTKKKNTTRCNTHKRNRKTEDTHNVFLFPF